MPDGPAFRLVPEGLVVSLRLTPKAAADRIGEVMADGQGGSLLKVSVTAVPEKGKANAALIKLLAKSWGLAKGDLEILSGGTARAKSLLIRGGDAALMARLTAWYTTGGPKT